MSADDKESGGNSLHILVTRIEFPIAKLNCDSRRGGKQTVSSLTRFEELNCGIPVELELQGKGVSSDERVSAVARC